MGYTAVPIAQVLLLLGEESAQELGPPLWAALIEVERFYNHEHTRAKIERHYVSPFTPTTSRLTSAWHAVARLFRSGAKLPDAFELLREANVVDGRVESGRIRGRYSRTVDQRKLIAVVRELLGGAVEGRRLVIVTDQEMTPPPEWRYIIWDHDGDDSVISTAPTDPKYWRQRDEDRLSTIKHRVRTACLSVSGQFLGLERCNNPECFLFEDVDSVTALDFMTRLGPEHEKKAAELVGWGFQQVTEDPELVQLMVNEPSHYGERP